MRYKLYCKLAFILMFIGSSVFAQKEITVSAVRKKMSRGEQPGFQVNIPEGKLKDVMPAYKKQLEQNTKANASEVAGELIIYGAVNKNFSLNPFIVYSKFLETIEGVDMTVFVTEDSLNFISDSSDGDKVAAINKAIRDFAISEYKKIIIKKLEVETGKLNQLKKGLTKLSETESDNLKDISKKQHEIQSYQAKMETNKKDQASKTEQISNQQNIVNAISDKKSPEYELATKNLKNFKKEMQSLEKDGIKMRQSIDDNNAEIKQLELKNEDLKKQQADAKDKIDAQDAVVKGIEKELNGIK